MVYSKNSKFVLRKIHDTYFFIDITDNYMDEKLVLTETNEIGSFIWKEIDGIQSINDITVKLLKEIVEDVPYATVFDDIQSCLIELEKKGIVFRED